MLKITESEQRLLEIVRKDARYSLGAYEFVKDAVSFASHVVYSTGSHVTGAELLEAIRRFGRERYGILARDVFESWGVTATEDFGEIVFRLVEEELLLKTDEDSIEDFRDVFRFEEAFSEAEYWKEKIHDQA